jgi:hypothetical protein
VFRCKSGKREGGDTEAKDGGLPKTGRIFTWGRWRWRCQERWGLGWDIGRMRELNFEYVVGDRNIENTVFMNFKSRTIETI